ncbi:MAG TPA: hypothetical protein PK796_03955 [Bacteroidales bacterium]|nr:hypothetical protein [Bacteroidales bacterium]
MKTINTLIILTSMLVLTASSFKRTSDVNGLLKNTIVYDGFKTAQTVSTDGTTDHKEIASGTSVNLLAPAKPVTPSTADYLRFDVNKYIDMDLENNELPEPESFDYLKFDVNDFTEANTDDNMELPVSEFDYLRFDISKFIDTTNADEILELPAAE